MLQKEIMPLFVELFDIQYATVNRLWVIFCQIKEDREEVVSEVFCILWKRREELIDIEDRTLGYLSSVETNLSIT